MVATVVIDHQPRGGVVKVGPTDEFTGRIEEPGLNLRSRKACLYERPTQPRFHRRLGGSTQFAQPAQPAVESEPRRIRQPVTKSTIDRDHQLDIRESQRQISQRPVDRRGELTLNPDHFAARDRAVPHTKAGARTGPRANRNDHLYGVCRIKVQAEKPRSSRAGNNRVRRQCFQPCTEDRPRTFRQVCRAVHASSQPSPLDTLPPSHSDRVTHRLTRANPAR